VKISDDVKRQIAEAAKWAEENPEVFQGMVWGNLGAKLDRLVRAFERIAEALEQGRDE